MAGAVLCVPDEHLSIVLDPALATQDVVNAGCHLVPLKVIPKPERDRAWEGSWMALGNKCHPQLGSTCLTGTGHVGLWKELWGPGSGCAMKGDL